MKKLFTLFSLLLCCTLAIYAQNAAIQAEVPEEQKRLDVLKGTYALENLNPRLLSLTPSNLAVIIEKNRMDTEFNRIQLNENLVLIIYPRSKISNSVIPEKHD